MSIDDVVARFDGMRDFTGFLLKVAHPASSTVQLLAQTLESICMELVDGSLASSADPSASHDSLMAAAGMLATEPLHVCECIPLT